MIILQTITFSVLVFFVNVLNILTLWYLAGLYLVLLGWIMLLDDGDIFIGFLWVIDLGVGLIFFIFILHYSTFLHQKSNLDKTSRELSFMTLLLLTLLSILTLVPSCVPTSTTKGEQLSWAFSVNWYDYYDIFFSYIVTDLNLIHEVYFTCDSFEFFAVNFFLLYGIIGSILMTFLIKRIFVFMGATQILNNGVLKKMSSSFFIRNQDFLKQQSTSAGQRVWKRNRNTKL